MYRNVADEEFAEYVSNDIKYFVEEVKLDSTNIKSVLVFPPVNNYRRFLIHKICDEAAFADLHHFSIGVGCDRRTVVCFTKDLIRAPENSTMGIDQYHMPSIPPVRHEDDKKWKVMAAIDIYRPPAVRRLLAQQAQAASAEPEKPRSKPRRPDIQVYVPRPKRLSAGGGDTSTRIDRASTPSANRRHSANPGLAGSSPKQVGTVGQTVGSCSGTNSHSSSSKQLSAISDGVAHKSKALDVCKEQCHRIAVQHGNASVVSKQLSSLCDSGSEPDRLGRSLDSSCDKILLDTRSTVVTKEIENVFSNHIVSANQDNVDCSVYVNQNSNQLEDTNVDMSDDFVDSIKLNSNTNYQHSDDDKSCDTPLDSEILETLNRKKCDDRSTNYEQHNRKNRLILHGKVMSDVLVISDPEPVQDVKPLVIESPPKALTKTVVSDSKNKLVKSSDVKRSPVDISSLNPDECTWDMMFDENGDCLNPQLMEELTSKVGKVAIKTPRSDYKAFGTRTDFHQDEFSHVLEIYDFPPEFKTQDLMNIFSPYKDFEIKWVDDTHALGVFSSSIIAADVLAMEHPFLKTRPLHEATAESRAKARRSSDSLRPYRARPETCPALARRLVTGALGVKLKTARQEREAEKALLNQAREKKRLEARLKEEVWEGTIGGN